MRRLNVRDCSFAAANVRNARSSGKQLGPVQTATGRIVPCGIGRGFGGGSSYA